MSKEQKDELKYRPPKANGGYRDAWTRKVKAKDGKPKSKFLTKAKVASMIKANEEEKVKAEADHIALVDEVKGILNSQLEEGGKKRLRAAGASVGSARSEPAKSVADRCTSVLMEKFASMGSKAKKSG